MKIYTKTGDKGTTGLFGGKRVSKDDIRVEAYGTVDELNSFMGWLQIKIKNENQKVFIGAIQNELFVVGSHLASDPSKTKLNIPELNKDMILQLEKSIDELDLIIPSLKFFIIPGGSEAISIAHICRTVCRRAERRVVALSKLESVEESIIMFLNRLSDYLFTLSRFIAFDEGVAEIPWIPRSL